MKTASSSRRHPYPTISNILLTILLVLALVTGMVGCGGTSTQYTLSVLSTSGGDVAHPGTGTFTYPAGAVVLLEAVPAEGCSFVNWSGNVSTVADANASTTTVTMNGHYVITSNFFQGQAIQTWYDLDAIRNNLNHNYVLMNDLNSTTDGYAELASPTANDGKGWQPIGYGYWDGEQLVGEKFQVVLGAKIVLSTRFATIKAPSRAFRTI